MSNENDMCINFGYYNCRECENMLDFECENYESKNSRKVELNKLYKRCSLNVIKPWKNNIRHY